MNSNFIKLNNIYVDLNLYNFISSTNNIICTLLMNTVTEDGIYYLEPTEKPDMIGYIQRSKIKDFDNFNPNDYKKTTIKVGRIVRKLFNDFIINLYISDSRIEDFVNLYKSQFDTSDYELTVVEGEEIRMWYNENNYYLEDDEKTGSLWKSCMRQVERQKFLDLYCMNDNIKLLIMTVKYYGETKLVARALLWDDVTVLSGINSKTINIMDRIYSINESNVNTFKKWAIENKYIYKLEQNSKTRSCFVIDGKYRNLNLKLNLQRYIFNYYPYLDTFPYFNLSNGVCYNTDYYDGYEYILTHSDGSLGDKIYEEEDDDY